MIKSIPTKATIPKAKIQRLMTKCNVVAYTYKFSLSQQRQYGSKSGGRESGRRNFQFQPRKNSDFPEKSPIFHAKILTTFFSRQLKKLSFLTKYSHFHLLHLKYIINTFFSMSYKKTKEDVF